MTNFIGLVKLITDTPNRPVIIEDLREFTISYHSKCACVFARIYDIPNEICFSKLGYKEKNIILLNHSENNVFELWQDNGIVNDIHFRKWTIQDTTFWWSRSRLISQKMLKFWMDKLVNNTPLPNINLTRINSAGLLGIYGPDKKGYGYSGYNMPLSLLNSITTDKCSKMFDSTEFHTKWEYLDYADGTNLIMLPGQDCVYELWHDDFGCVNTDEFNFREIPNYTPMGGNETFRIWWPKSEHIFSVKRDIWENLLVFGRI